MPNIVNQILRKGLEQEFRDAGSCLVLSFDRLTVEQASELRDQFREAGINYQVVKSRLARQAMQVAYDLDMSEAFRGKCGVVFAPEERAISAAKLVREATKKQKTPTVVVTGGVIEGEAVLGEAARMIADMPDRDTVRGQLATAVSGPARGLATVVAAIAAGMARCVQARIDKDED